MRRVVVTGIGALTPIGNTYDSYKENLMKGVSGAGEITRFDASLFRTRFACEVKDFNIEDVLHRREARRMDPFTHYAIATSIEAMNMSGIDVENLL